MRRECLVCDGRGMCFAGCNGVPYYKTCLRCAGKGLIEMNIGDEIKARRTALGMTQDDLAKAVGVWQGRIGEWERGKMTPSLDSLEALAGVLGAFIIAPKDKSIRTVKRSEFDKNPTKIVKMTKDGPIEVVDENGRREMYLSRPRP